MKSLNATYGLPVSELEVYMLCLDKILQARIDKKPDGGIKIQYGDGEPIRRQYTVLKEIHDKLYSYLESQGKFSFGVCETCNNWDRRASVSGMMGLCGKTTTHAYDSCQNHSSQGAGTGINVVRPNDKPLMFYERCISCRYLSKKGRCKNEDSKKYNKPRNALSKRCKYWRYMA